MVLLTLGAEWNAKLRKLSSIPDLFAKTSEGYK